MADTEITMYGTTWCQDCKRAKQFFGEHHVPYSFVDVDADRDGLAFVERANDGKRIIPTIVFPDGSLLIEPSNAELATKLGVRTKAECPFYDLVVVGGGPTGLTAALYAAREGIETLVIDRSGLGGQAGVTERLDNYPGFPEGIGGAEFADRLVQQCRRFGVELISAAEVTGLAVDGQYRVVKLADGNEIIANAVLVAPGSTYRRLGVPGEEDFIGAGVHFCATCDGPFYRDQDVLVIGGGNSAAEEAIFLTKFARQVTIVSHSPALTASRVAQRKVEENAKIAVRYNSDVTAFRGNGKLAAVTVRDRAGGAEEELHPAGVFVFIGLRPNTAFLDGSVDLDQWGFITTDATFATSVPGVFAAGDARAGSTKQLVSAAGEGATAALMIRQYLQSISEAMPTAEVERDLPPAA